MTTPLHEQHAVIQMEHPGLDLPSPVYRRELDIITGRLVALGLVASFHASGRSTWTVAGSWPLWDPAPALTLLLDAFRAAGIDALCWPSKLEIWDSGDWDRAHGAVKQIPGRLVDEADEEPLADWERELLDEAARKAGE